MALLETSTKNYRVVNGKHGRGGLFDLSRMPVSVAERTKWYHYVYKIVHAAGWVAQLYLEIVWAVIIGCLGWYSCGLAEGGPKTPAKWIVLFHLWGLFFLVVRDPIRRLQLLGLKRKMAKIDKIRVMMEELNADDQLNLVQEFGQKLMDARQKS